MQARAIDVQIGDAFENPRWSADALIVVWINANETQATVRSTYDGRRRAISVATLQRSRKRLGVCATAAAHRALAKIDKSRRASQVRA